MPVHLFIDAVKCRIGDLCLRPSQVAGRRGDIYLGGVRGPQSLGGMHGTNLIAATAACILDRAGLVFIVPMAVGWVGKATFVNVCMTWDYGCMTRMPGSTGSPLRGHALVPG